MRIQNMYISLKYNRIILYADIMYHNIYHEL